MIGSISISQAQTKNSMKDVKFSPEQQEVLDAVEDMVQAFHNKDMDGVMSCYEPNTLIVFEPENPVKDVENIKKSFQEVFAISPQYQFHGHEVFINGDIAVHFTPWTMKGQAPDGSKVSQSGLSVAVLRKQADGKWLMVFDNPHGAYLQNQ